MARYIIQRLLLLPFLLVLFSLIVFAIVQAPPGDFLTAYVATLASSGSSISAEHIAALRHEYGLDQRIEAGQLLIGSPDSVVKQIERIADRLKPGVLDAVSAFQLDERTMKSIRLFGEKVLPRIRHF